MTQSLHSAYLAAPPGPFLVVLRKGFLASLLANIPMLALLLVPQLMRSRAGSEALLFVGATLYVGLIALALIAAAPVNAWAAPDTDRWTPGIARRTTRQLYRLEPSAFWQRFGEWFLFFVLAQAVGACVAWLMPYVHENPSLPAGGEGRWLIQYDAYALHAVTIYLLSCLSFAWFGVRLRQLALDRPGRLRTPSVSPARDV
jgi:hypothetical protein